MAYNWTAEKRELQNKTVEQQRLILAKWIKEVVFDMGCSCHEAERFFAVHLKGVLKPGYESFERPRFDRGSCCQLLHCQDTVR